jgi:hypothetical protein
MVDENQDVDAADAQADDPVWEEACRHQEAIRGLLRCYPKRLLDAVTRSRHWRA